uniref:Chromate transporter n=2 Tax=Prasinoderma singulare TaxID=676789 RepID=A0A7S3F368_9VIRI
MAKTWVTEDQFFAGLGLAQAMPGPLFNLAAFLGSAVGGVGGAAICWLGLFGPGVMLIFGVLPFWGAFRQNALYKRMLPGLNASAVGLIFAAVISMATNARAASKSPTWSTCVAVLAFYVSHFVKLPAGMWSKIKAPMIVVAGGGVGAIGGALGAY